MRQNRGNGLFSVYADLIKIKLSLAVTFSAVTGYFISQKDTDINLLFLVSGVFFLASGAAVLNQHTELRYDALMKRTKGRPLPLEIISPGTALVCAAVLVSAGVFSLFMTGIIPVVLGVFTILLYNLIYTRLKRVTSLAILPGALVGAIPPLIGYEAAGGRIPGIAIILFSGFMFMWQIPHFWLILIKYRKEYEDAGFSALVSITGRKQIKGLVYVWVISSTCLLILFSLTEKVFSGQISLLLISLNIIFILLFYYMLFMKNEKDEFRGAFIIINIFSLLVMILFIINSWL